MKRHAPAAARNRAPILQILRRVLPATGTVVEVGSGSGEHAVYFASHLPGLTWQPTDVDPAALASIAAWRDEAGLDNLRPGLRLDAASPDWPLTDADVVISINMVHIAPWTVCQGLVRGAARALSGCGALVLYGPFRVAGRVTAPSNERFDQSLRARNPAWGVRHLNDVAAEARTLGLEIDELIDMPANNLVVVFRRDGAA